MKILIAYGTRYGTTEKCAGILSGILKEKNYEVELLNLKKNKRVSTKDYDLIAVGGSFLMGQMNANVRKFAESNLDTLLNKKTALFMCGAEEEWEKEMEKGFPEELFKKASAKGYFGYELILDKMNPIYRGIIQKVEKTTDSISKINHENIKKFAEDIVKSLA
jgi:menaquinone-dependent protoporphyrinogen oxidase